MRYFVLAIMLTLLPNAHGQEANPAGRSVAHFRSSGKSRLVALADLGARTRTSLLVEAGDMGFLHQPVSISAKNTTVAELIQKILAGRERYEVEERGSLLIVSPELPAKPVNRILKLNFGPFEFEGKSISALDPLMGSYIREASGCPEMGFGWGGPPLDLDIPSFSLDSATFEDVVAKVAEAPEPTMWTVLPDDGGAGCIESPSSQWQVGFYDYGDTKRSSVFRQGAGPDLVK